MFLRWIYESITASRDGDIWNVLVAYLLLIMAKEDVGIERTLGGVYFANAKWALLWRHNERAGISIVCSTVCSGADQRKHQSTASLAFVREIHRWPGNSPHKRTVTREMFPFDDVIMLPAWREHHRYCRTTLSIMPLGWISAITWAPDIWP